MAKEYKTRGTGITERQYLSYSGDDVPEGLRKFFDKWDKRIEDGGGFFGGVTISIVQEAEAVLATADDEEPLEDSPVDFAQKILKLWRWVKHDISADNADQAARWAFELGYTYATAVMKQDWEEAALKGAEVLEGKAELEARQREERQAILEDYEALRKEGVRAKVAYNIVGEKFGKKTDGAVKQAVYRARKEKKGTP